MESPQKDLWDHYRGTMKIALGVFWSYTGVGCRKVLERRNEVQRHK